MTLLPKIGLGLHSNNSASNGMGSTPFIITVDTTQAGSAADTFVLPLQSTTTNIEVFWGDGNSDIITSPSQIELTHVYSSGGTYQIEVVGQFGGVRFDNGGDRLKLSSIDQWGSTVLFNLERAFRGCSNMVANYSDSPDVSSVAPSAIFAFQNCSSFNGDVSGLNWPSMTDTSFMFSGCSVLDQDFSSWNISSLTTAVNFLSGVTLSTANYGALLVSWEGQTHNNGVNFHGGNSTYTLLSAADTARTNLITDLWSITDGGGI
jgi:hypothetical protein